MAITTDDFNKIWASTSPLTPYEFSESNYKEGWNFIGSTPPSRQMWDFLQKNNDEKMQYLADNYLPLSGGTMTTGNTLITMGNGESYVRNLGNGLYLGGTNENNASTLALFTNSSAEGFQLQAGNGTTSKRMIGKPDGTLTWDNKDVERVNARGTNYIRYESGLQMVFDRIALSGATSYTTTYTYPVAFVAGPIIVTGTQWAQDNEQITIRNDNTTKFDAYITNAGNNSHNVFFISIGRWK